MKKKIMALALAVALIAIVVGSSLAYFTAEDKVTNTFTIGSVKIDIYENDQVTDTDTFTFGKLTPIVNVDNPSEDESYMKKVVEVKNTGKNDAYIRVHVAVPAALADTYLRLDWNLSDENWVVNSKSLAFVDDVEYDVYTYDYKVPVAPNAFTAELLKGVYLDSTVDLQENANGDMEFIRRIGDYIDESGFVAHTKNDDGSYTSVDINVLVAAQAIQADGFADYEAALANFTTHPWAN